MPRGRAKKEFKAALAVDTSHAPSCVGLAELLLAERDYRKAEELVKQAWEPRFAVRLAHSAA